MKNKKTLSLSIVGIIALCAFIALLIILAVNKFEPLTVDITFRDFAYSIRGEQYGFMFWFNRIITELAFIYIVAVIIIVIIVISKAGLPALIITAGEVSTYLLSTIVKLFVKRERPIEAMRWQNETSSSFPSAHSSTVMFVYVILAYFGIRYIKNKYVKYSIVVGSIIVILLVGFSRMILGVHYFTDVLAGYSLGLAIAFIVIILSELAISKNYNFLAGKFKK